MKKNFNKISLMMICTFVINCALFAAPLKDGVYKFDYERMLNSLDVAETYKAFGMDAFQDILKSATGSAVLVKGGKFVDPETGVELKVSLDGKVTSPDNSTIQGSVKNGNITFFGYYEENNQTIQITVKGTLEFYNASERAGRSFDGTYYTTDLGTGRKQIVHVKDGMYTWEYEDKEDGDFEGWPMIVEGDGSFYYTSEYTTRSVMKGFSEVVITNKTLSKGKVEPNGSISLNIISTTNGSGMQENETPYVFTGSKASSESDVKAAENIYGALEGKTKVRNAMANSTHIHEVLPDWYKERMEITDEKIIACGKKSSAMGKEAAIKFAESVAVYGVRSYLGTEIKTNLAAESKNEDKYLYKTMDSLRSEKIDYKVLNQFFDETTQTAYVMVEVAAAN